MTTRFIQGGLWPEITDLARKSKRHFAAVAYIGAGASRMLPLKRGDVLVTDMSVASVKAGLVNPHEVQHYLNRGVEVHSYTGLHAKVFVFDRKAIIGSPNASTNSSRNLIEAAVVTTEPKVVQAARSFISSLKGEFVTPEYVKSCLSIYKPPRYGGASKHEGPTLWIAHFIAYEFDHFEQRISDNGVALAKKKLKNQHTFVVESIPLNMSSTIGDEIKVNDLIIMLYRESPKKALDVYPPCRVVRTRRYIHPIRKNRCKFVFIEQPKKPRFLDWGTFKQALQANRINKARITMTRKIRNPAVRQKLLGLWESLHE